MLLSAIEAIDLQLQQLERKSKQRNRTIKIIFMCLTSYFPYGKENKIERLFCVF